MATRKIYFLLLSNALSEPHLNISCCMCVMISNTLPLLFHYLHLIHEHLPRHRYSCSVVQCTFSITLSCLLGLGVGHILRSCLRRVCCAAWVENLCSVSLLSLLQWMHILDCSTIESFYLLDMIFQPSILDNFLSCFACL